MVTPGGRRRTGRRRPDRTVSCTGAAAASGWIILRPRAIPASRAGW
ncbi:hypothetical protein TOK_2785 [Pseudonocardia sp. N23]|nr:hypothetical protein TOK_2785 [Pseudonocardia sp. N23]